MRIDPSFNVLGNEDVGRDVSKHMPLLSFLGAVVTTNTVNTITSVVVINNILG